MKKSNNNWTMAQKRGLERELDMYHAVLTEPRHAEENMMHVFAEFQRDICSRYKLNAGQFTQMYCTRYQHGTNIEPNKNQICLPYWR